jgi:hypothetical protein
MQQLVTRPAVEVLLVGELAALPEGERKDEPAMGIIYTSLRQPYPDKP